MSAVNLRVYKVVYLHVLYLIEHQENSIDFKEKNNNNRIKEN